MLPAVILFLLLLFIPSSWNLKGFNTDYLSRETTGSLRGIFAIVIIFCHAAGALTRLGTGPEWLNTQLINAGNLSNAVFFFLSGIGLMYQRKLNPNYMKGFLWRRCTPILLTFSIVILLYNFIYWHSIPIRHILNEFLHGRTLNSNSWFIFAILWFYLIFYLSFRWVRSTMWEIALLCAGFGLYVWTLSQIWHFPGWWYSSCINFLLGIFWGMWGHSYTAFIQKFYFLILAICGFLFWSSYYWIVIPGTFPWNGWISSAVFTLAVILVGMKVRFTGMIWQYLGKLSLEIYLLQGLVLTLLFFPIMQNRLQIAVYLCCVIIILSSWLLHTLTTTCLKFINKDRR